MPNTGKLKLELVDVKGKRLGEPVDVMLRHLTSGTPTVSRIPPSKSAIITNLRPAPDGLYSLQIDPASYLPVGCFVNVQENGGKPVRLRFPADPRKVRSVDFPDFAKLSADGQRVLGNSDAVKGFDNKTGSALYLALDDTRRAGYLNIMAKAAATPLTSARTVSSYIQSVLELRGDRFHAKVTQELREETKNSAAAGLFEPVSSVLHRPPDHFDHAGSFKTPDNYGNLQLTFFSNGADWIADIDIDDANGLAHVFQVLRNELTGRPTNPYDIREILIGHQNIDPGYEFVLGARPNNA